MSVTQAVRRAIYKHFAETGTPPTIQQVIESTSAPPSDVTDAYGELANKRLLVLSDGHSIRMAPPFAGVETQHLVEAKDVRYYGNCAWDAFGIVAALGGHGRVKSECAQTGEPFDMVFDGEGPDPSCDWLFHSLVRASRWWEDVVFT